MNILMLPSWYMTQDNPLNGIFFREQAHALYSQGVNVFVISLNVYSIRNLSKFLRLKNKKNIYTDNGIITYSISYLNIFPRIKILYLLYSALILRKHFRLFSKQYKIKVDLVHIHSALDLGLIYYLSKIRVKFILTEHSTLYSRNLLTFCDKKLLPKVFSSADYLVAVGNGLKNEMEKYTKKDINVIFNLVSLENYPLEIDKCKNKFRFFSIGDPLYKKGFDVLISAFSKTNMLDSTELIIAGLSDPNEITKLQEMIRQYDLKNVKVFGQISRQDVANFMYNCDCFVLPSRFETFGVVFAEAMLFGKPVIATITGGPDSFVIQETGLLVHVDDIYETANALEYIYINRKKYNKKFIAKYALDNFSSKIICEKIINIYENILKNEK